MRPISRTALARDAAFHLGDGACKDLTLEWSRWEDIHADAATAAARDAALQQAVSVCERCAVTRGCADQAQLTAYTGIAAGQPYRNGRLDTHRGNRNTERASPA